MRTIIILEGLTSYVITFQLDPSQFKCIGFVLYNTGVLVGLVSMMIAVSGVYPLIVNVIIAIVGVGVLIGTDRLFWAVDPKTSK